MSRHLPETDLALFITGDIGMWKYVVLNLHLAGCEDCRKRIEAYRQGRQKLKQLAAELPAGADWDRLAAEMTANIRVGLAAGECVAPRRRKITSLTHRPVALWAGLAAGAVVLLGSAWWLNLPASDADSLSRIAHSIFQGGGQRNLYGRTSTTGHADERGPIVEASADSVDVRENGVMVSIPQATSRPVAITVSAPGSASARYVDDDGQISISSVYAYVQ